MEPGLVLLSGDRGTGKTTVCRKAVSLTQEEGFICGGLLTLNRGDSGRDVFAIHAGEARQLTVEEGTAGAVQLGRFLLDPQSLEWGNAALLAAVPCDLLIIDELGPLEIERRQGWASAFDVLAQASYSLAVVVVRPELLTRVQSRLPGRCTAVLTVTAQDRRKLPQAILDLLRRQIDSQGGP